MKLWSIYLMLAFTTCPPNLDASQQPQSLDHILIKFGGKTIDRGITSMGLNNREWPHFLYVINGSVETIIGTAAMLTGLSIAYGKKSAKTIVDNPKKIFCLAVITTTLALNYNLKNKAKD